MSGPSLCYVCGLHGSLVGSTTHFRTRVTVERLFSCEKKTAMAMAIRTIRSGGKRAWCGRGDSSALKRAASLVLLKCLSSSWPHPGAGTSSSNASRLPAARGLQVITKSAKFECCQVPYGFSITIQSPGYSKQKWSKVWSTPGGQNVVHVTRTRRDSKAGESAGLSHVIGLTER